MAVSDDVNDSNVDMSHSHGGISRKRLERSSPFPSPTKLTQSPLTNVLSIPRTGTKSRKAADKPQTKFFIYQGQHFPIIADFIYETEIQHHLQSEMNVYIAHRVAFNSSSYKYPFFWSARLLCTHEAHPYRKIPCYVCI